LDWIGLLSFKKVWKEKPKKNPTSAEHGQVKLPGVPAYTRLPLYAGASCVNDRGAVCQQRGGGRAFFSRTASSVVFALWANSWRVAPSTLRQVRSKER